MVNGRARCSATVMDLARVSDRVRSPAETSVERVPISVEAEVAVPHLSPAEW